MTRVLVTGASGFIAKHIIHTLLTDGYDVTASVRSERSQKQVEALFSDNKINFVHLDLNSDEGWTEAMQGIDVLMHTASPFPAQSPKNPQDLIRPAVDGTTRALTAAHSAGIKRIILTSSCVAIYKDSRKPPMQPSTRDNWTDPNWSKTGAYDASKTLAEKAAWDFAKKHPDIKLTTINPGAVFGPPLDKHYGTSLDYIDMIFSGKMPALPNIQLPCVDVRDVATMHVNAINNDKTYGLRFPAVTDTLTLPQIAKILAKEYPGRKIRTHTIPDIALKLGARLSPVMKEAAGNIGMSAVVDGSDAPEVMGFSYISAADSILASAEYLKNNA